MYIDFIFILSVLLFFWYFRISIRKNIFESLLILLPIQKISGQVSGFSIGIEMAILLFFVLIIGLSIFFKKEYYLKKENKNIFNISIFLLLLCWITNLINTPSLVLEKSFIYSFFHLIRITIIFLFVIVINNSIIKQNIDVTILRKTLLFYAFWLIVFFVIKTENHFGYDPISKTLRVSGYFVNSTTAGLYFIVMYCLLLFYDSKLNKINVFLSTITALMLFITGSKLAIILFLVVIIYKISKYLRKLGYLRYYFIVIIGIVSIVTILKFDRFAYLVDQLKSGKTIAQTTEGARLQLWEESLTAIAEKPILGHGFFSARFSNIQINGQVFRSFHSFYLDLAYGSGIIALLMLFLLFSFSFFSVKNEHRFIIVVFFLMNITENFFMQFIPLLVYYHIIFHSKKEYLIND